MVKIALNFKTRKNEKLELSSQGTYNFQILQNGTLIIADYKYAKIFKFALLDLLFINRMQGLYREVLSTRF